MRLILVGFGVVGRSFAELLLRKGRELADAYGMVPRLVAVADRSGSVSDERGLDIARVLAEKKRSGRVAGPHPRQRDVASLIREVEADVVVETTPTSMETGEPGLSHMRAAFLSKKHVITSNKGPIAVAFHALQELARHNGVELRYSGAVGGGTPILDFGRTCSRGDDIVGVTGILNGTCNFILTSMEQEGASFEDALRLAQTKGYAEADPSLDVDGYDSAMKLVIIANHLLLKKATIRDVRVEGIRHVTPRAVARARDSGKALRLIASVDGELSVSPVEVERDDPICVSGTYNAVKFNCRNSGPKVVIGRGAGGPETASSVLRDLIDIRERIK